MTNSKSTKRALLTSTLAILACVAMLIGTTFAWFTDTASTGVNKIQAGNLKMEVSYKNTSDGEFAVLDENTNVFMEDTLWEPGHVEYAVLNVKNIGTLALKYKLGINIASETESTNVNNKAFKLSDYIKYAVIGDETDVSDRAALVAAAEAADSKLINAGYTSEETPLKAAQDTDETLQNEKTVTLVVWMPTTVGNDANHAVDAAAPTIDLGINVVATQYTHESDSFGKDYDAGATYPDVAYVTVSAPKAGSTENTLAAALTKAATMTDNNGVALPKITAALGAGEFALSDKQNESKVATTGKEVTLVGSGADKTIYKVAQIKGEASADYAFDGAKSLTIKNMTLQFASNTDFQGFIRAGAVRIENCTLIGMGANWGVGEVVFENCTFKHPSDANEWTYSLWTYAGNSFTFNNCTFEANNGKVINLYRQGVDSVVPVVFNNCKFNNAGSAVKAAVKINGDHKWNVAINNCTTTGNFPESNDGLWEISNAITGTTITVDGIKAYGN